ncbi:hypothetical protein RP20_CCG011334 [Aedes albopictus]|nr:hypothetical protein RP20_CCG011334 [Aedes albopictus]
MPPKAKYPKKKATAPTKQEKLPSDEVKNKAAAGRRKTGGSEPKKHLHPLKPQNAESNVGVQSNAAKLFAAIAAKQCTVVKTAIESKETREYDSGSEHSTITSDPAPNQLNECKAMLLKPEPADDPTDILSSVSSSNSLSVNIQFADIMKKLESIENNVQEMGKHQAKCLILGAQANAKIDYLLSEKAKQPTVNVAAKPQESLLVPVNSLTDLENAEKRCEDDSYVESVIREMGQMHGKNRFKTRGGTVCLQIIDHFVDRSFFRQCSWTGISKTFDENQKLVEKIAFSKYEKFINLFYRVIRNADEDFTKEECNKFFKQCLRNSKQRVGEQMLRLPAARNRTKRIPVDSNDYAEDEDDSEDRQAEGSNIEYIEEIVEHDHDPKRHVDDSNDMIVDETVFTADI